MCCVKKRWGTGRKGPRLLPISISQTALMTVDNCTKSNQLPHIAWFGLTLHQVKPTPPHRVDGLVVSNLCGLRPSGLKQKIRDTKAWISEWCYLAERLLDNLYGILDL